VVLERAFEPGESGVTLRRIENREPRRGIGRPCRERVDVVLDHVDEPPDLESQPAALYAQRQIRVQRLFNGEIGVAVLKGDRSFVHPVGEEIEARGGTESPAQIQDQSDRIAHVIQHAEVAGD